MITNYAGLLRYFYRFPPYTYPSMWLGLSAAVTMAVRHRPSYLVFLDVAMTITSTITKHLPPTDRIQKSASYRRAVCV